jgi:hypothetical protein
MTKIESIIIGFIMCVVVPACLFVPTWWLSFLFLPEKAVPITALSGLILGALLDVIFIKRWIKRAYTLNPAVLIFLYLLFSLFVFAMFMGVPIFHPLLGIVAGVYMGRKLRYLRADSEQVRYVIKYTALFTACIMCLICVFSATVSLLHPDTPSELKGMLNLTFPVTWPMVVGLIFIGGSFLVAFQYWSTKKAAAITYCLGGNIAKQS